MTAPLIDDIECLMLPAKLTLKNYRCFSDTTPATIEVGSGFTAFVGPNNSGKSSFLRFLFEFNGLWNLLQNRQALSAWITREDQWQGIVLREVSDPSTIVCDLTGRAMTLDIEFPPLGDAGDAIRLSRIQLFSQPQTTNWGARLFSGYPAQRVTDQTSAGPVVRTKGSGNLELDTSALTALAQALMDSIYIPPFRNAINEGTGSYFGLSIGTAFISQWNEWKTGSDRNLHNRVLAITDDISRVFGYERLEINAAADGRTLLAIINNRSYRLNDVGAGLAQFIILFGNVAMRQPAMLLIDEPELHLHPALQLDFLTSLTSYTKLETVVFATHSIGLARSSAERVYGFQKSATGCVVKPFEQTPNFAEFVGEMSFSAFRELGHNRVLLVEGVTELRAVQQFLRLLGKDHEIVLLPLGGSAMIRGGREPELEELKRLTPKIAALIDSEKQSADDSLAKSRADFLESCKGLHIPAHATDLRAFENYLSDNAVKSVKGAAYSALQPYELLAKAAKPWAKDENWRIARAMTRAELLATDVGQFLEKL